jgi:hypothetical protein
LSSLNISASRLSGRRAMPGAFQEPTWHVFPSWRGGQVAKLGRDAEAKAYDDRAAKIRASSVKEP